MAVGFGSRQACRSRPPGLYPWTCRAVAPLLSQQHPLLSQQAFLHGRLCVGRRPLRPLVECLAEPGGEQQQGSPPPPAPPRPAQPLVAVGGAFYAALTLAGVGLGELIGGLGIARQLATGWGDPATWLVAAAWMAPLVAALAASVALSDRVEALRELKQAFQTRLIPTLHRSSSLGLGALSVAAGIGEEVFFRAFLQTAVIAGLAALPLPAGLASPAALTAVGIAATSTVFGALHALSPAYFWFATWAGVLFGYEYHLFGLTAAAITHSLYDWLALLVIMRQWGGGHAGVKEGS